MLVDHSWIFGLFLFLPLFDQIKYWQPISVPNMLFLFGQFPRIWNPKIWDSFPQSTNPPLSSTLALSAFSLIYCFSGIKASFHFLLQQLFICWLQYLDFMAHYPPPSYNSLPLSSQVSKKDSQSRGLPCVGIIYPLDKMLISYNLITYLSIVCPSRLEEPSG